MTSLDDTQPKSPFRQQTTGAFISPEPEASSSGCALWGVIAAFGVLLALAIVGLAAAAGWTSGVRIAQGNATATHQADIDAQILQISTDVAGGNQTLLVIRLAYLATQTPGIQQVAQLQQTATALYFTSQPTATPTATSTPETTEPVETVSETTSTEEPAPTTAPDGGFNLLALLDDARAAVREARWEEAIETLDIIISVDAQFEKSTVSSLMSEALNQQALKLFRSGESGLAEAIALANRADQFGPLNGDVNFEREVALLYLNARSRINTSDFTGSIRLLNEVLAFSPNYLNTRDLLLRQYIAYGDALNAGGQPCQAVQQYDNAIAMGSAEASGKRSAAQTICENGTPTPQGFVATPDPNNPAPIGQP
jgi:tetratricopeptide (TPR) repeat protein